MGEINPQVLNKYGIKQRVAVFGLKVYQLLEIESLPKKQYKPISKFPVVERDISMFVGKDTKYSDIASKH